MIKQFKRWFENYLYERNMNKKITYRKLVLKLDEYENEIDKKYKTARKCLNESTKSFHEFTERIISDDMARQREIKNILIEINNKIKSLEDMKSRMWQFENHIMHLVEKK